MLFKLSVKNMKKSIQDYAIYFLTLVLGVGIFYVFNSLDSQKAMLELSESTREIVNLLMTLLGGVSVFVSFILGFLIIYANNFLIKRRKREFGIYMTLGMGKGNISKILVTETLIIGVISLGVGLILGIFASQFMSIFVAKMFEADMTAYTFAFSSKAAVKTIVYFGIMYLSVLLFNTITISRYKLIDLITAVKRNEKIKIKNPVIAVITFLISICMLGYAYYNVTEKYLGLTETKLMIMIVIGCVATFLFFWSLSGFLLKMLQGNKRFYLKNLNMFVMRQMNSKINTTVFSMTVICLMLFVTIGVLSTGVSLNEAFTENLKKSTPKDICIENMIDGEKQNDKTVQEILKENDFDMSLFLPDYVDATAYETEEITWKRTLSNVREDVTKQFPMVRWDSKEFIVGISDYNKMARFYGIKTYDLKKNEYMVLCTFKSMKKLRDESLKNGLELRFNGKIYQAKYKECKDGYLNMSQSNTNMGIILVPDEVIKNDKTLFKASNCFAADYNGTTDKEKAEIEKKVTNFFEQKKIKQCLIDTKLSLYESSRGLSAIVTFIAIYLGIIFLISSAALLALKELSESADNKERYEILRKIGTDQKMINRALFSQIGIFFLIPLLLAAVHSIFGIIFANKMMVTFGEASLFHSILVTAAVIVIIYGGYFIATYMESKKIIEH